MKLKTLLAAGFVLFPAILFAQEEGTPQEEPAQPWTAGYEVEGTPFTFYPRVAERFRYDTNIFLENNRRDEALILMLTGGVTMTGQGETWQLGISHESTQFWHNRRTSANRLEHNGIFRFLWKPDVDFEAKPYFRVTGGNAVASQPVDAAGVSRVTLQQINAGFLAGLDVPDIDSKFELEYAYLVLTTNTAAIKLFEHDQWLATVRWIYSWEDDFSTLLELSRGTTNFFGGIKEDNDIRQIRAGYAWQINEEVAWTGTLGYHDRNYRRGSGVLGPNDNDFEGVIFSTTMEWRPDDENRFTAGFAKDVQESILSNFMSRYVGQLAWTHQIDTDKAFTFGVGAEFAREASDNTLQHHKQRYTAQALYTWQIEAPLTWESSILYRSKITGGALPSPEGEYIDWQFQTGLVFQFGEPVWPPCED